MPVFHKVGTLSNPSKIMQKNIALTSVQSALQKKIDMFRTFQKPEVKVLMNDQSDDLITIIESTNVDRRPSINLDLPKQEK